MIICNCNGVTSDEILKEMSKQKSLNGTVSLPIIACQLNIGNVCGSCTAEIESMIDEFNHKKTNFFLKFLKID